MDSKKIFKFYRHERIATILFFCTLIISIFGMIGSLLLYKYLGGENKIFTFFFSTNIASILLSICCGFIHAYRVRECPVCNLPMTKILDQDEVFQKCKKCGLMINTHVRLTSDG